MSIVRENKFYLRPTEQKKLRSLFCQVCGRWVKDKVTDPEEQCDNLEDLMLTDGAIPVVRFCSDCKKKLVDVLIGEKNDSSSTNES